MSERFSNFDLRNRRTQPRFDFRAGITIRSVESAISAHEPAISQNLSQEGIYVLHSKILVPNERVEVMIPLFSSREKISLAGSVTWVGIDDLYGDSHYWVRAGIRFNEVRSDQKQTLSHILSERTSDGFTPRLRQPRKIDFVM